MNMKFKFRNVTHLAIRSIQGSRGIFQDLFNWLDRVLWGEEEDHYEKPERFSRYD